MATKLQLKQLQINDGAYGSDRMGPTGLAAGDVLLVTDVSNTSGSSYGYNMPMSASALRQAILQDLGGSSDLRVTGNAGFSGTLKVAGAVTGAAGTFTSLNARAGGITHAGNISGVGSFTATGSHYTSGSITQGGTGAVKFEGAIQASSSISAVGNITSTGGTVSASAGTFSTVTADKLNVHIIDSISTTENHLEVTDKVIISAASASFGSSAAAIVGSGFQVGDGSSAVASVTAMQIRVGASASIGLPMVFATHGGRGTGESNALQDRMQLRSGSLLPSVDKALDLGVASSNRWNDIHMQGAVKFDSTSMLTSQGAYMVQSYVPASGYGLEHSAGQLRIKGFTEQNFVSASGPNGLIDPSHPMSASADGAYTGLPFTPGVHANQVIGYSASIDTGNSGSAHSNIHAAKGNMDVYLNGVKLVSGSEAQGTGDYHFAASANKVCLYDALDPQDLLVVRWLKA